MLLALSISARTPAATRPPYVYFLMPITRLSHTSVAQAFYLPNRERTNLTVLTAARVNRILPSNDKASTFVAEAVEFEHGGQDRVVHAAKEVILSAGCLQIS